MVREESSNVNVNRRRIENARHFLKVLPMAMAGLYLLNTVLSYFNMEYCVISYLAGVGAIPLIFIFMASYMFHFCSYHRMFLWYIVTNDVVCWTDYTFGLPVSDKGYLLLHFIIAGTFLFIILYLRFFCTCKTTN